MPAVQSRTRTQIRIAAGRQVGGYDAVISGTTTSAGSTTTLVDISLMGGDDEYNNWWVYISSGAEAGKLRRVNDYTGSTGTITIRGAAYSGAVAAGVTFELWQPNMNPTGVNDAIDQAVGELTNIALVPDEDTSQFAWIYQGEYAIPSNLSWLSAVDYRTFILSKVLHRCEQAWSESVASNVTVTADTKDRRVGSASVKLVVGSVSDGTKLATTSFNAFDLRAYDRLEAYMKVTTAVAAGDLNILLDNTASCASPLETLAVPALAADTWTYVNLSLSNPELNSAIISLGLKYGASYSTSNTIWIDHVLVVDSLTAKWERLPPWGWSINKESRKLVVSGGSRGTMGTTPIKLVGYDKPALLSSDSSTSEIDPQLVTILAASYITKWHQGGTATDPDGLRATSAKLREEANILKLLLPNRAPGTREVV